MDLETYRSRRSKGVGPALPALDARVAHLHQAFALTKAYRAHYGHLHIGIYLVPKSELFSLPRVVTTSSLTASPGPAHALFLTGMRLQYDVYHVLNHELYATSADMAPDGYYIFCPIGTTVDELRESMLL